MQVSKEMKVILISTLTAAPGIYTMGMVIYLGNIAFDVERIQISSIRLESLFERLIVPLFA